MRFAAQPVTKDYTVQIINWCSCQKTGLLTFLHSFIVVIVVVVTTIAAAAAVIVVVVTTIDAAAAVIVIVVVAFSFVKLAFLEGDLLHIHAHSLLLNFIPN
jgi:hypothetical protein